jgi:RNase H-like domain found in reverse transcriptase/Integrase zinc binding domain
MHGHQWYYTAIFGGAIPPSVRDPLRLATDASDIAYGAVLLQRGLGANVEWRPVGYVSRKLSSAEERYTVSEKEAGAALFAILKFRHILLGRKFTLVTDHTALQPLLTHSKACGRLARWAVAIQEFEFDVEYARGNSAKMSAADALSRDVAFSHGDRTVGEPCIFCGDVQDIAEEQEAVMVIGESEKGQWQTRPQGTESRDLIDPVGTGCDENKPEGMPESGEILSEQTLEVSNQEDPEFFKNEEGLLCRTQPGSGSPQVWIPRSLRRRVLGWAHGSLSGHSGIARTRARLIGGFWAGLRKDVEEFIKGCLSYFLVAAKSPGRQASMVEWTPSRRFEVVAADVLPISPTSRSGMKKVLVITDCLTRFVGATALLDETASTLTRTLLDRWFLLFGPPERFLTDRGGLHWQTYR